MWLMVTPVLMILNNRHERTLWVVTGCCFTIATAMMVTIVMQDRRPNQPPGCTAEQFVKTIFWLAHLPLLLAAIMIRIPLLVVMIPAAMVISAIGTIANVK